MLFTVGSLLLLPVTALTLAAGLAFRPVVGITVAWTATTTAAAIGHVLGRRVWRASLQRLAGARLNALSRRLGRRGILSTVLLRIVPIAPFMVVNLVAGATHVRVRDFVVGTALGTLPGIVLLVFGAHRVGERFAEASLWLWIGVGAFAVGGAAAILLRLRGRDP